MGRKYHMPKKPKELAGGRPHDLASKAKVSSGKPDLPNFDSFSMEEINKRAETISPLLQQFLDFCPSSHWGLNE
jgi:hypothetical protein